MVPGNVYSKMVKYFRMVRGGTPAPTLRGIVRRILQTVLNRITMRHFCYSAADIFFLKLPHGMMYNMNDNFYI